MSDRRLAVRLDGLRRTFGSRTVLDDVDLEVRPGEFVALLGASGSGKTTLLRNLAGLDRPDGGTVLVPERCTVVFQEPRLIPSLRVWRNVALGQVQRRRDVRATARAALDEVGLGAHADAWPSTLSGGEAQRVALARALVRRPQLLLLDEPFAALDALTRLRMQDLVADLCARHRPAVLLVTHDVDEALRLATRVLVLRDGRLTVDEHPPDAAADPDGTATAELRSRLFAALGVASPNRRERPPAGGPSLASPSTASGTATA